MAAIMFKINLLVENFLSFCQSLIKIFHFQIVIFTLKRENKALLEQLFGRNYILQMFLQLNQAFVDLLGQIIILLQSTQQNLAKVFVRVFKFILNWNFIIKNTLAKNNNIRMIKNKILYKNCMQILVKINLISK